MLKLHKLGKSDAYSSLTRRNCSSRTYPYHQTGDKQDKDEQRAERFQHFNFRLRLLRIRFRRSTPSWRGSGPENTQCELLPCHSLPHTRNNICCTQQQSVLSPRLNLRTTESKSRDITTPIRRPATTYHALLF